MSVTAMREYATEVVSTATTAAATAPAAPPYARSPSHHEAAIAPRPSTSTMTLASRYEGELAKAWNGASR